MPSSDHKFQPSRQNLVWAVYFCISRLCPLPSTALLCFTSLHLVLLLFLVVSTRSSIGERLACVFTECRDSLFARLHHRRLCAARRFRHIPGTTSGLWRISSAPAFTPRPRQYRLGTVYFATHLYSAFTVQPGREKKRQESTAHCSTVQADSHSSSCSTPAEPRRQNRPSHHFGTTGAAWGLFRELVLSFAAEAFVTCIYLFICLLACCLLLPRPPLPPWFWLVIVPSRQRA